MILFSHEHDEIYMIVKVFRLLNLNANIPNQDTFTYVCVIKFQLAWISLTHHAHVNYIQRMNKMFKALTTVAKSKPNSFSHLGILLAFGYVANR